MNELRTATIEIDQSPRSARGVFPNGLNGFSSAPAGTAQETPRAVFGLDTQQPAKQEPQRSISTSLGACSEAWGAVLRRGRPHGDRQAAVKRNPPRQHPSPAPQPWEGAAAFPLAGSRPSSGPPARGPSSPLGNGTASHTQNALPDLRPQGPLGMLNARASG